MDEIGKHGIESGCGGATDRGDEERSECRRVLHEEVFRNGGGVPWSAVELQPTVALPSRGDEGERVSQALNIADGGARRRRDLGAKGAGCGAEVLRKLGWPQRAYSINQRGVESPKTNRAAFAQAARRAGAFG